MLHRRVSWSFVPHNLLPNANYNFNDSSWANSSRLHVQEARIKVWYKGDWIFRSGDKTATGVTKVDDSAAIQASNMEATSTQSARRSGR